MGSSALKAHTEQNLDGLVSWDANVKFANDILLDDYKLKLCFYIEFFF
jgi:hypothetical protein